MLNTDEILCLSGGIDSTIAYYWLKKPRTIFFDTGTYSDIEKERVLKMAPNTIIDTSLNFGGVDVDESAFVVNRNLLFAARASAYAPNVWMAGVKDDLVCDKNPDAFLMMSNVLNATNKNDWYRVDSPFWSLTKAQIIHWLLNYRMDAISILANTFSCYTPVNGKECLACPACFRKWNALWENGIHGKFKNMNLMDEYVQSAMQGKYPHERNKSIVKAVAEYKQSSFEKPTPKFVRKTYCFDIDGVITIETEGHDYENRTPNKKVIEKIRKLYHLGHEIILHTARWGTDWTVTSQWLSKNKVPHNKLILGKPKADFYIDDHMISMRDL